MRRPNGTGSIVKLSGNRRNSYAVRIPYHDERGHVHQKYLSYHRTVQEAQAALDEYNSNYVKGSAPASDTLSITWGVVYQLWSERKYSKAGASSVMCYKASWGRLEHLSGVKMRSITIDHLQAVIDADEKQGLSKSSIANDKLLMRTLFRFAIERDIVTKDYSEFVQLPRVDIKHEKGAFTDTQLKQIERMASSGVPWADTVLMLCYTGFRITEFLTLTRFSYDSSGNYLRGGNKTEAGKNRIVPIHPKIIPYFFKWLEKSGDTIICGEHGKPLTSAWYRNQAFAPVMKQLGIAQATPHWCRHTFSSHLHAAGVPELEHKRLMGHADKDVTEHYTHTDIDQLKAAIYKLA